MAKPLAFLDIDGTVIRSSLLVELVLGLVEYGIFPRIVREELRAPRLKWINRQGSYEEFIMAVVDVFYRRIGGCRTDDVHRVAEIVAYEQREQVYVFTRELIRKLRPTHTLIAVTGSPIEVVRAFDVHWKFGQLFASELAIDGERYTGVRTSNPVHNKAELVQACFLEHGASREGSVAVGDTESDIGMLEHVERPIAFNPNMNLARVAKERRWEIVVERKDVIYRNGELWTANGA